MHIHIAILRVDVCIAQSDSYRFVHDTFVSKTRSCPYLKRRLIAIPYNAKSRLEYEFGLEYSFGLSDVSDECKTIFVTMRIPCVY